jgi:dipeptidase E
VSGTLGDIDGRGGTKLMQLVLASGGIRTEERRRVLIAAMQDLFGGVKTLLFIPWAVADHEAAVQMMNDRFGAAGVTFVGIHTAADPVAAMREADGIVIGGGNTFRLLRELYAHDLLGPIRERVRTGMPYLGVSAGTNVAGPTIRTTNDMPITSPPSMDALGLVPFQINPHFIAGPSFVVDAEGRLSQHFGETRDDRIAEFHEEHATPVIGLWEGALLRVQAGTMTLAGGPARIFRRGLPSLDIPPGSTLPLELGGASGPPASS